MNKMNQQTKLNKKARKEENQPINKAGQEIKQTERQSQTGRMNKQTEQAGRKQTNKNKHKEHKQSNKAWHKE